MIHDNQPNRKPLYTYIGIACLILLLLNVFVFPVLLTRSVQEIGYSDFLKMVDEGKVKEVSLSQDSDLLVFAGPDRIA